MLCIAFFFHESWFWCFQLTGPRPVCSLWGVPTIEWLNLLACARHHSSEEKPNGTEQRQRLIESSSRAGRCTEVWAKTLRYEHEYEYAYACAVCMDTRWQKKWLSMNKAFTTISVAFTYLIFRTCNTWDSPQKNVLQEFPRPFFLQRAIAITKERKRSEKKDV